MFCTTKCCAFCAKSQKMKKCSKTIKKPEKISKKAGKFRKNVALGTPKALLDRGEKYLDR